MPRQPKKPWSADLPLPPWAGGPEHEVKPAPGTITVGHSTAVYLPERAPSAVAVLPGNPPRQIELAAYGHRQSIGYLENATAAAARARAEAIEKAVTGWATQAGVSVEQWAKTYGYTVDTKWEGFVVTFVVRPMFGHPGQEVVLPQPPPSAADRS